MRKSIERLQAEYLSAITFALLTGKGSLDTRRKKVRDITNDFCDELAKYEDKPTESAPAPKPAIRSNGADARKHPAYGMPAVHLTS